jgi:protein TonB
MALRIGSSFILALAITMGLFFLMQSLISQDARLGKTSKNKVIEFVRVKQDSAIQEKQRELPDKPKKEEPPPPPDLDFSAPEDATGETMSIAASSVDLGVSMAGGTGIGVASADSDVAPLVRVLPVYPARAQERGIEGYVIVEFSIGPDGTVKDATVLESEPASIFDRAALRAIRKWKYKPKVEDGVAVMRTGIKVRMPFELEK